MSQGQSLPPSALEVLEQAKQRFSDKVMVGAPVKKLDAFNVRRALATAKRSAAESQVPACFYEPGGSGDPLVILKAEDLATLLKAVETRGGVDE